MGASSRHLEGGFPGSARKGRAVKIVNLLGIPEVVGLVNQQYDLGATYGDVWMCHACAVVDVVRQGNRIMIPEDQVPRVAEAIQRRALRRRDWHQSA
jgi:hypothetical protein